MKFAKMAVMTGVNRPFEIRQYALTTPPAGMARLTLIASGVCGTDLHIHRGKIPVHLPAAIGHEFVGKIDCLSEEDANAAGIKPGDCAIVDIACPCGKCALCQSGDDANCLSLGVTNGGDPDTPPHFYGGFGEVNYSPVKNLIRIPETLDPATVAVFACAGPTAIHAFRLAARDGFDAARCGHAVVQGLGPVGLFAVAYLRAQGVGRVTVVTAHDNARKAEAAQKLGADEVLSLAALGAEKAAGAIREMTGGVGADLVFEASGNPQAFAQGLDFLRNRGLYLVPGQYSNSGGVTIEPQLITFRALQIIGSSQYSVSDVTDYLAFLQAHRQLHEIIRSLAARYPVAEINRAFDDAKAGKNIKTMLV